MSYVSFPFIDPCGYIKFWLPESLPLYNPTTSQLHLLQFSRLHDFLAYYQHYYNNVILIRIHSLGKLHIKNRDTFWKYTIHLVVQRSPDAYSQHLRHVFQAFAYHSSQESNLNYQKSDGAIRSNTYE